VESDLIDQHNMTNASAVPKDELRDVCDNPRQPARSLFVIIQMVVVLDSAVRPFHCKVQLSNEVNKLNAFVFSGKESFKTRIFSRKWRVLMFG
jgi:hypothetical protein